MRTRIYFVGKSIDALANNAPCHLLIPWEALVIVHNKVRKIANPCALNLPLVPTTGTAASLMLIRHIEQLIEVSF